MEYPRLEINCRPARPEDTPQVLDLTSRIWEGNDYVPGVWEKWLADTEGILAVGEHAGVIAGIGKVTHLTGRNWWLEGLRAHPDFQGRGIASQMHEYLLDYWLRDGSGELRLATNSRRVPVHHLCERTGFRKVADLSFYRGEALDEPAGAFHLVSAAEAAQALAFASLSQTMALAAGLADFGWKFYPPEDADIADAIKEGAAWWWGERQGILLASPDEDEGELQLHLHVIACTLERLAAMLMDIRRLAHDQDCAAAVWMAPLYAEIETALASAGFNRPWEDSVFIYERSHPQ